MQSLRGLVTTLLGGIVFCMVLLLPGCSVLETGAKSPASKPVIQYATIKLIKQSDKVTAEGVTAHVERVRSLVNQDLSVSVADIRADVRTALLDVDLAAEDRLLLSALIAEIEHAGFGVKGAGGTGNVALTQEDRVRLGALLDWIEEAAIYARLDS